MNATPIDAAAVVAGRVEVCGVGWVKPTAEGGADPAFLACSQMATTTRDPRVCALAFRSCGASEPESCALLNARRWAQLDADNGEPWLFLRNEATRHKEREQADEALFHIGAAARVDDRYFAIPGVVARRAGNSDIDLPAAHVLAIHALGGMAAQSMPLLAVSRACRGPALADANRRQRCDASEAHVDAVAALHNASFESLLTRVPDPLQWSSGRATSMLDRLARQAVVGEAQSARQWIEAGGSTLERYTARETERRRRLAEELARAASASVAASVGEAAVPAASTPYSATPPPAR